MNNKLIAIRRRVLKNHPFFANLLFTFKFKKDQSVESMQIDADNRLIRYSSDWLDTSTAIEQEFMVCRLLMSICLKHHTRRGQRDPLDWNMAAYYACLPYLHETSWFRSQHLETPYGKKSAEQIYQIIHNEQPPQMPQEAPGEDNQENQGNDNQDNDQPGNGDNDDNGDPGSGGDNNQRDSTDDSDNDNQDNDQPGNGDNDDNGDPGSGGDSESDSGGDQQSPAKSDQQKEQERKIGEVKDGGGAKEQEAELDKILQQSSVLEKQMGVGEHTSDQHAELLEANHTHKIDWKDILREFITESDKSDYNWIRPNRRYLDADVYLPARHATNTFNLTVAIDTSASIDMPLFEAFWREFTAICNEMSVNECRIIQCDAAVKRDDRYFEHDIPTKIEIVGRGGTEFKPVFELIEQDSYLPNVLLYFTDLQVYREDFPEHQPDYQVLWIVPEDTTMETIHNAPFGQAIKIK